MTRPTEEADAYFSLAEARFKTATTLIKDGGVEYNMAMGQLDLCTAMRKLNTGIRATYILLDEVKTMLARPR